MFAFKPRRLLNSRAFLLTLLLPFAAQAQSALEIYTDSLVNGWQNWSWSSTVNEANATPVQFGSKSLSVNAQLYGALSLHHSELDMNLYGSLSFWIHGGAGGQDVQVLTEFGASGGGTPYSLPTLTAQWQQYEIPLTALGIANVTDMHRISFQRTGGSSDTFYLDAIQLKPTDVPSLVHVTVNAAQIVRTADNRWFGANTAIWDNDFGDTSNERNTTVNLLTEMGLTTLRFPGGSLSDEYHWATGKTLNNSWAWNTTFAEFAYAATNIGAEVFITVNYGTGTPEEAAGWVRHANITNNLGINYWEIGNENYGTWETDENSLPNHAYTYATRAQQYIALMKAADPSIKVGVVAVPGEDAYDNGYTDHPANNPRTGQTHYGWTPIMLARLKELGVAPDFLVHHHYPQWTDPNNVQNSPDNDATLLQSTSAWAGHAAELRQHIEDYFGSGGENIELLVTENNSDAGSQGRQSTSLVNGLYYADSLSELMKTEFNAFIWWDLRNGTDAGGYFGSDIYGWRDYGDLGMINGLQTRHPTFYAAKLIQHLVRGGDLVVQAASDYSLLACHAVSRINGELALLVINKSLTTNLNTEITLNGFVPSGASTIRSYGIPQDEAARTGAPLSEQDLVTSEFNGVASSFNYNFPPLSMTVLTLSPATVEPPTLRAVTVTAKDEFVFELQGQTGGEYIIENSPDQFSWNPESTNFLSSPSILITNTVAPGSPARFWRAVIH